MIQELPSIRQQTPDIHVQKYHISLVMNCNLRCSYCCTNHGRFDGPAQVMKRSRQELLQNVLAACDHPVSLEFGTGETFLAFDEFLHFVDTFRQRRPRYREQDTISVTTNGTMLDRHKIQTLVDRGVTLVFSIDGGEHIHRRQRTDAHDETHHPRILANYKYYLHLQKQRGIVQNTSVISVLTRDNSLLEVDRFWAQQGIPLYTTTLALPRVYDDPSIASYTALQQQYLQDLRKLALEKASQYDILSFLSDYQGPLELLEGWRNILLGNRCRYCTLLSSFYAVNSSGEIFPCELLMNRPEFLLGSLETGIDQQRYHQIAATIGRFEEREQKSLQAGVCTAACFVDLYLLMEAPGGHSCQVFLDGVNEIMHESFNVLEQ